MFCNLTPHRPGTKFVVECKGPVDHVERVQQVDRGCFCIRIHYKDGTIEDITADGPVMIRSEAE